MQIKQRKNPLLLFCICDKIEKMLVSKIRDEIENESINILCILWWGAPKWGWVYRKSRKGLIAGFSNSVNRMLTNKLGKLIEKINPNIIISAHPFSTQMCGILKKKGKLKIDVMTIMTDFKYHEQWLVRTSVLREVLCVK